MALTRKFLSALGIEADKIDEIIVAHTETVDAIKEERNQLKASSDELASVKAELETAKAELKKFEGKEDFESKYNALKTEFDTYKTEVQAKDEYAKKVEAYKAILREAKVSDKRIDAIVKISCDAIKEIKLGKDNKPEKADDILKNVKTEWADFIVKEGTKGADVVDPPDNDGGNDFSKMTLSEKMAFANEHPDDASVKEWLGA